MTAMRELAAACLVVSVAWLIASLLPHPARLGVGHDRDFDRPRVVYIPRCAPAMAGKAWLCRRESFELWRAAP